jgi:hypothetical protein
MHLSRHGHTMADSQANSVALASGAQNGEVVFFVRRGYVILGLACLIGFVVVGIASAYGIWIDAKPERRLCGVLFVSSFWGVMASLAAWTLLGYWSESLTISNGSVRQQCVMRQKEVQLKDVNAAQWRLVKGGGLKLRTSSETFSIYFDNFEQAEALWLVRHFRDLVPEAVQQNWPSFCHRIAVPLRDRDVRLPCGPDDVVLTRRRWDWYFIPFVLVATVFGIVAWLKLGLPRMLAAPLMPMALWLMLRLGTPKEGMKTERMTRKSDQGRAAFAAGSWAGGLFAVLMVVKVSNPPMANVILGVASVVCMGGMLWSVNRLDREFRGKAEEAAKSSVADWESTNSN